MFEYPSDCLITRTICLMHIILYYVICYSPLVENVRARENTGRHKTNKHIIETEVTGVYVRGFFFLVEIRRW